MSMVIRGVDPAEAAHTSQPIRTCLPSPHFLTLPRFGSRKRRRPKCCRSSFKGSQRHWPLTGFSQEEALLKNKRMESGPSQGRAPSLSAQAALQQVAASPPSCQPPTGPGCCGPNLCRDPAPGLGCSITRSSLSFQPGGGGGTVLCLICRLFYHCTCQFRL